MHTDNLQRERRCSFQQLGRTSLNYIREGLVGTILLQYESSEVLPRKDVGGVSSHLAKCQAPGEDPEEKLQL